MIIPRFMRFYSYKTDEVLNEYAVTFFALLNDMFRIKADELLDLATIGALPHLEPNESKKILEHLERTSKGLRGLINEAKVLKDVK